MKIPAEYVRTILDYDPDTGIFRWRHRDDVTASWNARYEGKVAGNPDYRHGGRKSLSIHKQRFFLHRLAFVWMEGRWPEYEIDHINCNPSDNRWLNLRAATSSENKKNKGPQSNNKIGLKGVSWKADKRKWRAVIKLDRHKHLGYFDTPESAHAAYCAAAREHYGEFAWVA